MCKFEKKTFRVGIVGLGAISNTHILSLLSIDGVEISAICDNNPHRLAKKAQEHGLNVPQYTDYKEMIDKEELDTVHILTPHYLHAPMTVYALEHGLDVFLEKPMGISPEDIESIRRAEQKSGKQVCVCFQNRFNPTTFMAKEITNADGGVVSAYATVVWDRDAAYYAQDAWRGKWATEGGGVMINQAIHNLDLLLWLCGVPSHVEASCANRHLEGIIEVEDTCEARLTYDNGRVALFYATTAHGEDAPILLELKCPEHRIMLYGDTVFLDGVVLPCEEPEIVTSLGKECWGNGHIHLISLFYRSILEGKPSPVSVSSAAHAVRILLQCYESSGIKNA